MKEKVKPTVFRIKPPIREALEALSVLEHRPQNSIVNEALYEFLKNRTPDLERKMETVLEKLKKYKEEDPNFKKAIKAVAEAEGRLENDPAEGQIVKSETTRGKVRELLVG